MFTCVSLIFCNTKKVYNVDFHGRYSINRCNWVWIGQIWQAKIYAQTGDTSTDRFGFGACSALVEVCL